MTDLEYDPVNYVAAEDPDKGKTKNLWQKLADVTRAVGYIQQLGQYELYGKKQFSFVKAIDIRKEIREQLASRNVILKCSCVSSTQRDVKVQTKDGERTNIFTEAKFTYEFINGDAPEQRELCEWIGWAEGTKSYAAYGSSTGSQRHFLLSFFLIPAGEEDPETYDSLEEERRAKARALASRKAAEVLPGANRVGTAGYTPSKEDLEDTDPFTPRPKPIDESWRNFPLDMCKGLADRYKGQCVGDISLKHLIGAQAFVKNVRSKLPGYDAPGHLVLANALQNRIIWEIDRGNIDESVELDGAITHTIIKK